MLLLVVFPCHVSVPAVGSTMVHHHGNLVVYATLVPVYHVKGQLTTETHFKRTLYKFYNTSTLRVYQC